jgi:hypothetical protein
MLKYLSSQLPFDEQLISTVRLSCIAFVAHVKPDVER